MNKPHPKSSKPNVFFRIFGFTLFTKFDPEPKTLEQTPALDFSKTHIDLIGLEFMTRTLTEPKL